MANALTIIEELDDGRFVVEYDLEDVKFEKTITKGALRADLIGNAFKTIYSHLPVTIYTVDLEEDFEYEYPYAVTINKWTYYGSDVEYDDVECITYKRKSAAENYFHKRNLEIADW